MQIVLGRKVYKSVTNSQEEPLILHTQRAFESRSPFLSLPAN